MDVSRFSWLLLTLPGNEEVAIGLGLSIVDSLDTMLIMGFDDLYRESREWIKRNLHFRHVFVQQIKFLTTHLF